MANVVDGIGQPKKSIRILEKINLLTLLLLMCLIESNLSTKTRLTRKIRITKKVLGAIRDKNKIATMTSLP